MGTAEFHWLCGKYVAERELALGRRGTSLLAAAYRMGVPVYTSSPGDSSIGMNVAELELRGNRLRIDPARDVNETAAIVWDAKSGGGKSGVLILGGGSPKNFVLQTEPQIQEVLGLEEAGHDYYLQSPTSVRHGRVSAPRRARRSRGKVLRRSCPTRLICYRHHDRAAALTATRWTGTPARATLAVRPPRGHGSGRRAYRRRRSREPRGRGRRMIRLTL
jgi:deoxyhypusine synthase